MDTIACWRSPARSDEGAPHQVSTHKSATASNLLDTLIRVFNQPASGLNSYLRNVARRRTSGLTREDALKVPHTRGDALRQHLSNEVPAEMVRDPNLLLLNIFHLRRLPARRHAQLVLAITRVIRSLLFGVTPSNPLTFVFISALLIVVTLVACSIPARRATKVDPVIAVKMSRWKFAVGQSNYRFSHCYLLPSPWISMHAHVRLPGPNSEE